MAAVASKESASELRDKAILEVVKTFYADKQEVQGLNNVHDSALKFFGKGDPERLLDDIYSLGYDLAAS